MKRPRYFTNEGYSMQIPELIILNANIITCNPAQPRAEAVHICSDRIKTVGTSEQVKEKAGPSVLIIDGKGKTVTPGFIDPHLHPRPIFPDVKHRMHVIDLFNVSSLEELINVLKVKARLTPENHWIQGRGYQDSKFRRHPLKNDLDKVSTKHLIIITHTSGHVSVVNSKVLDCAQIDNSTSDPEGGIYDRNVDGSPNGVCREAAVKELKKKISTGLPTLTETEEEEGLERCLVRFFSKGITSIGDAGVTPEKLSLYQRMQEKKMLPLRVIMMILFTQEIMDSLIHLKLKSGFGGNLLKIGPMKLFAGNSLSGKTCWLSEPYVGSHKDDDPPYYGIPHPVVSSGLLNDIILKGHSAGFQWAVHANGDRDITAVLNAYESALDQYPRDDHRHRIEHCSIVGRNTKILERIKKMGVIPVFHEYTYEHGDKYKDYGKERIALMHAYRSAIDLGIQPGGHSDWPVSAADPMTRIQSMVTRKDSEGNVHGPEQRISPEEALYVWTAGNARILFEEKERGSIQKGKLGDLVILSEDPTKVPVDNIKDIEVEKTILGGKILFDKK